MNQNLESLIEYQDLLNALIFSYLNLLIIYQSIGFTFRFGDFWAISGIIVATYILKRKKL